jgi:hypothetical protein
LRIICPSSPIESLFASLNTQVPDNSTPSGATAVAEFWLEDAQPPTASSIKNAVAKPNHLHEVVSEILMINKLTIVLPVVAPVCGLLLK